MTKKDESIEVERFNLIKAEIRARLIERGDLEKLKNDFKTQLKESGWKSAMIDELKAVIREKGIENVTVQNLYSRIACRGRRSIHPRVVQDMLTKIRACTISAILNPDSNPVNNNDNDNDDGEDEDEYDEEDGECSDESITHGLFENGHDDYLSGCRN